MELDVDGGEQGNHRSGSGPKSAASGREEGRFGSHGEGRRKGHSEQRMARSDGDQDPDV
jgi:hypothetical protein